MVHNWMSALPILFGHYIDYMEFQVEKAYLLQHFQEYRIIQPGVVFIHGLPSSLSHPEVLERELSHLGYTYRINFQYLSKDFYSAFVEFESELSAALLIIMLNQMPLMNRVLRVFYGSTKFCPHFLKNHKCLMSNCNYAHYYVPHLTHLRDQAKEIDHSGIAYIYIYQQLPRAVEVIRNILHLGQNQGVILSLGRERLSQTLNGLTLYGQPQQASIEPEKEEEVEWSSIEKEIESEAASSEGEKRESRGESGVQEFLDAAQRFLTKLIFESSVFVY